MILLWSNFIVIISCVVVDLSGATYYGNHGNRCSLSDIPACGPKGVCNCSLGSAVNCHNKGWRALPSNLSLDLFALDFGRNDISCVPIDYFERFTNLTTLVLDENKIRESFYLPRSMMYFYIRSNQLEDVNNFFIHCDNLRLTKFGFNKLTTIPEGIFHGCSQLSDMRLRFNYLSNVSFAGLDSLTNLVLYENQATLQLSNESLSSGCASLGTLNLHSTHLMNLPSGLLRNCTRLKFLYLSDTGITDLHPDSFIGPPLFKLDISSNNLHEIPENIFYNQTHIAILLMSSIKLKAVPARLLEITSVQVVLDMGNNDLTEIPASLFSRNPKGYSMTTLFLSGNKLKFLPKRLFASLFALHNLYLFGNKFTTLPGSLLVGTSVENLYIFQNLISNLTAPLFGGAGGNSTLRKIEMRDNPIHHLSSAVLDEVIDGGEVELSCENLTLPTIRQQLNVTCIPPSMPMVIIDWTNLMAVALSCKGFHCLKETGSVFFKCESCPVGTYGTTEVFSECKPCPRGGFYQDGIGQYSSTGTSMNCKECNPGTFVNEGAGKSPLSCKVCPSGTNKNITAGFRACSCLDSHFRRDRFGKCEPCPQDGGQCANDYMTVRPNYFWDWSFRNVDDYRKFVKNLQTFDDTYLKNETKFEGSLPKFHECLKTGRCTNEKDNIAGNCAEGYTGWMCTACERNYFPILGFCRSCPELSVFILEVLLVVSTVVIAILLLTRSHSNENSPNSRSLVDRTLALGKIFLGFYQIMGEFWESIDVVVWPHFFKVIAAWLDLLQFNISNILVKPSCFNPRFKITPYTAFIVGSSFPYFAVVCALFVVVAIKLRERFLLKKNPTSADQITSRVRRYQNNTFTFLVLLLFVTYTSTCNVTFALYPPTCDTFSLDEHGVHNITLLRSDYSIDCSTATHRRYQIASYFASIYVIALPTVLCFFLWRHTRKSQGENRNENPKWVNFFSENYKKEFWFWEIVELVRKLSQTLVVVIFGWNSYFSIVVTLTLAVLFLSLHISFKPMKDKLEYYLQLASLWAIFFNMLVAAVPFNEVYLESTVADIVATLLVIINTGVIGVTFVVIFVKLSTIMLRSICVQRVRRLFHRVDALPINNNDEATPLIF